MKKSLNYTLLRVGHEDVPDDCMLIHHTQIEEDEADSYILFSVNGSVVQYSGRKGFQSLDEVILIA